MKTHFINDSFSSEYCYVMLTFASGCRLLTVRSPVMSAWMRRNPVVLLG